MGDFSSDLYTLLHKPSRAKEQVYDPQVYRPASRLTFPRFRDHLRGVGSVAVSCVDGGKAKFLCLDVDARFRDRLTIVKRVLEKRNLAEAAFAIDGSRFSSGKIVVCLDTPIPQVQGYDFIREILADAAGDLFFRPVGNEVTAFPTMGDGSFVRILGRNLFRSPVAISETVLDLEGDVLWDLTGIVPANIPVQDVPRLFVGLSSSPLSSRARALISEPYRKSTSLLFGDLAHLGFEARRLYPGNPRAKVDEWFALILANSPDLNPGAMGLLYREDVRQKVLTNRHGVVLQLRSRKDRLGAWKPLSLSKTTIYTRVSYGGLKETKQGKIGASAVRVYDALAQYVTEQQISPHCFGMTVGRVADAAGYADKKAAQKATNAAQDAGLLFRLDRGEGRKGGLCTLFCLRGEGESIQQAFDDGTKSEMFAQRLKDREQRGLEPPHTYLEGGTLRFRTALQEAA